MLFVQIMEFVPWGSFTRFVARYGGDSRLHRLSFTEQFRAFKEILMLAIFWSAKADNTMGIMVSISGYSGVAISQASGRKTTLLLFDAMHIYMFLSGTLSLRDIISRVRRHASQTGEAYLAAANFGG